MVIAFWCAKLCRYILMLYLIRHFLCYFDFPRRISLGFCCKLDMLLFSIILVWCLFPFTRFGFNEYVLQIFCRKKKTKSQPRSKLYYAVLQRKKKDSHGKSHITLVDLILQSWAHYRARANFTACSVLLSSIWKCIRLQYGALSTQPHFQTHTWYMMRLPVWSSEID